MGAVSLHRDRAAICVTAGERRARRRDRVARLEHRAAPSQKPIKIELAQVAEALALQVVDQPVSSQPVPRIITDGRIVKDGEGYRLFS